MRITLAVLLGALGATSGCLDDGSPLATDEAALAGTPSPLRPEIGRFIFDATSTPCMATLITPQVVVTASWCATAMGKNTTESPPAGAAFSFTGKDGVLHTVPIDRVHSFWRDYYDRVIDDDFGTTVAIAHLATPVPASWASPAGISIRLPDDGTTATVWGWDSYEELGKQRRTFTFTRAVWPYVWDYVDRGGPVVYGGGTDGGDLWGTVHWYSNHDGSHVEYGFTPLPFYIRQIEDVIHRWDGPDEVGIDRPGMDYANLTTTSALACRAQCEAQAQCRAFSWVASANRCYLKEGIPELRPGAGITSGIPARFELGTDRPGNDLTWLSAPRADACAVACTRNAACRAWTWVNTNNGCWLKSTAPAAVPCASCTSGTTGKQYEIDVDRPGWGYTITTQQTAMACSTVCAGDQRCKAYTWDAWSKHCELKDTVGWANHTSSRTSGVKRGLEVDFNRSGSDYRQFANPDLDPRVCQSACARDSVCQAWTFDGRSGKSSQCNLKNAVPAKAAMQGVVSGLKGYEMM